MVVRSYEILNRNINSEKELWDTAKESETYKAENKNNGTVQIDCDPLDDFYAIDPANFMCINLFK